MSSRPSITFRHLEIAPRFLKVVARTDEFEVPLEFSFDREIPISSTVVGLALATLCGQKFETVAMDFEIDDSATREIARFTEAEVEAHRSEPRRPRAYRQGNVLSFSGGFDSLAAWALMPEETHLVSLDFGGWFEREAKFFRRFEPLVITTNARSNPTQSNALARNHWSSLAIGALLTTDYFQARYHTFGNILGESFASPFPLPSASLSLLAEAGYTEASFTAGLTEIGTARVAMQAFPTHIADSITSLAGVNDRKRFLKITMSHLIRASHQLEVDLPPVPQEWARTIPFDNSYTTALGYLYYVTKGRGDLLRPLFRDVPQWLDALSGEESFTFHEHFNVDYYRDFPTELWPGLQSSLARFGFRPYGAPQYEQATRARQLLNQEFGMEVLTSAH